MISVEASWNASRLPCSSSSVKTGTNAALIAASANRPRTRLGTWKAIVNAEEGAAGARSSSRRRSRGRARRCGQPGRDREDHRVAAAARLRRRLWARWPRPVRARSRSVTAPPPMLAALPPLSSAARAARPSAAVAATSSPPHGQHPFPEEAHPADRARAPREPPLHVDDPDLLPPPRGSGRRGRRRAAAAEYRKLSRRSTRPSSAARCTATPARARSPAPRACCAATGPERLGAAPDLTRRRGRASPHERAHRQRSAIDDLPDMWDGFMRMVRPGLGLSAFGANIMNLPPDYTTSSHDESRVRAGGALRVPCGLGWIVLDEDGTELALDAEQLAAVGPGMARTLASGPDGLRVLIIGWTPGRATSRPTRLIASPPLRGDRRDRPQRLGVVGQLARPRLATSSSASASSARRSASASVARASLMRRSAAHGLIRSDSLICAGDSPVSRRVAIASTSRTRRAIRGTSRAIDSPCARSSRKRASRRLPSPATNASTRPQTWRSADCAAPPRPPRRRAWRRARARSRASRARAAAAAGARRRRHQRLAPPPLQRHAEPLGLLDRPARQLPGLQRGLDGDVARPS